MLQCWGEMRAILILRRKLHGQKVIQTRLAKNCHFSIMLKVKERFACNNRLTMHSVLTSKALDNLLAAILLEVMPAVRRLYNQLDKQGTVYRRNEGYFIKTTR